jgi:uncharacterized membrane protein YraQ (UPF0718 family)
MVHIDIDFEIHGLIIALIAGLAIAVVAGCLMEIYDLQHWNTRHHPTWHDTWRERHNNGFWQHDTWTEQDWSDDWRDNRK